jgi:hypothetical protein
MARYGTLLGESCSECKSSAWCRRWLFNYSNKGCWQDNDYVGSPSRFSVNHQPDSNEDFDALLKACNIVIPTVVSSV